MSTKTVVRGTLALCAALAGVYGCGSSSDTSASSGDATLDGAQVFSMPLSDGNSFTCSTCHSLSEPSADGIRRPGHQVGDATRRSAWKNGKAHSFLEAVNSCVTDWMVAPALSASDPRFIALQKYLDAQAKVARAPNIAFEIATPPADPSGGDATRGRALFNQSCVVCHGVDAVGTIRGPSIANSMRDLPYVANRIRRSGSANSPIYPGLSGGVMPFWATDRLTDGEVRDLVAFVTSPAMQSGAGGSGGVAGANSAAGAGGSSGGGGNGGTAGASAGSGGTSGSAGSSGTANGGSSGSGGSSTGCGATHPHVGWIADLGINTGEGQVSGKVAIVDNCTLELRDFSYNGEGIDTRVYGSKDQSFMTGFIMGDDLLGKVFKKQTLRVKLPADKTLDDLSWVSIRCVPAKYNFGAGQFKAP